MVLSPGLGDGQHLLLCVLKLQIALQKADSQQKGLAARTSVVVEEKQGQAKRDANAALVTSKIHIMKDCTESRAEGGSTTQRSRNQRHFVLDVAS